MRARDSLITTFRSWPKGELVFFARYFSASRVSSISCSSHSPCRLSKAQIPCTSCSSNWDISLTWMVSLCPLSQGAWAVLLGRICNRCFSKRRAFVKGYLSPPDDVLEKSAIGFNKPVAYRWISLCPTFICKALSTICMICCLNPPIWSLKAFFFPISSK